MNNFDQSSTGENIQLNVFYDSVLAEIYFEDFEREVEKIKLYGRDNYLYLIGDSEKPYFKKSQLSKMKRDELLDLCEAYELGFYDDAKRKDMIDELLKVSIRRHYEFLASEYTWHGIQRVIEHDYYITRGYSQGDAVLIVSISEPIDQKYIDRIFWDSPVTVHAQINGVDYWQDSFLNDEYEYNKLEVIKKIQALEISDYAKKWIIEHLPDYPEYL